MFRRDEQVSPPLINMIDLHGIEEKSPVTEDEQSNGDDEQSTDDELFTP